jgi:Ca2+-transporting ATPase
MSTKSSSHDGDLESSLALDRSSTSSSTSYYSIISTDGTSEAVSFLSCLSWISMVPDYNLGLAGLGLALNHLKSLLFSLSLSLSLSLYIYIYITSAHIYIYILNYFITMYLLIDHILQDLQSEGGEEISSASNEVSINVNLENIARMVKEKDLDSLQNFGGIQVIAKALDTDLENGIRGDEQDIRSRRIASTISTEQAPKQGCFQFLVTISCNSYIILLLSVSAVLSLGFGIKEEGWRTGWEEGVLIIVDIIILVLAPLLHDFWLEHSQKTSRKQKPLEMRQMESVEVFRGGYPQKVSIGDVLVGDIVCLEGGSQILADGLFISGELLKLDYDGLESTIDDRNPFLFYGTKVVDGTGRMLVTSVGMDTTWGQLMNQVTQALDDKAPLPAKLDRVNTGSQIIGLSISILILIVSFLNFELGKEDFGSNHPDFKGKPTASKEVMDAIKRIVIKPYGKTSTLTTSLTMLLVGVTEGIPVVIYRNYARHHLLE